MSPNGKRLASVSLYDEAKKQLVEIPKQPASLQRLGCTSVFSRIAITDTATGDRLGELIPLANDEWVIVEKEGRFEASSDRATELIGWWDGVSMLPLANVKEQFWQAGLLAKLLGVDKEPGRYVQPLNSLDLPAILSEPGRR